MLKRNAKNFLKEMMRYTRLIFVVSDFVLLNGSYLLALLIRFGTLDIPHSEEYFRLLGLGNVLWLLLLGVFKTHQVFRFEPIEANLLRTFKMVFTYFGLILIITYLLDFREFSRMMLVYYLILLAVVNLLYKIAVFQFLKYIRKRGINLRTVGIVGYNDNAVDLERLLKSDISQGYRVLGYFTDEPVTVTGDSKVLGELEAVHDAVESGRIELLYIAVTTSNADRIQKIIKHCERRGVRVRIIPNFQRFTMSHAVEITYLGNVPVLNIRKEPLSLIKNQILKRSFDIVFSLIVLVGFLSWMFPIVALLIAIDSRGSIIFKQRRSGINGKIFTCYKFRTMVQNKARDAKGTIPDDPRITRMGRFLRKSRIDEFPQFYNVLIGQMSIVGPRPHMIVHTEEYGELVDKFMVRHMVQPGITGWAQTVGELDEDHKLKEMKEKVSNDIWYIENWSFLLDLKIIMVTGLNVFRHDKNAK